MFITLIFKKSTKDSYLYIGWTNNLEVRLKKHQSGKILSTKNRRP
ncbi:GIY-YIG nuclease family protein [Patescibacteria group bacterium]